MSRSGSTIGIALATLILVAIHTVSLGQDLGANKSMQSVETVYSFEVSAGGIGADQQETVSRAVELIKKGQLATADSVLDGVLSRFAGLMGDAKKAYVCFRKTKDFRQFLDESQEKQTPLARSQVTRVHDSFAQALQMKAYIASSRKEWNRAADYLKKKMSYAPYETQPYLEMGYILNGQGKPQEAVESYKKGYVLAVAHGTTKTEQAIALRGLGYSQIEIGDLEAAVKSFTRSLEIEPGNKVALNELRYIEQLRASGH